MSEWSKTVKVAGGTLVCHPATPIRFNDLEAVLDGSAVSRKCFCMWWRREPGMTWSSHENRDRFSLIVEIGPPPGLIGYLDAEPVGWVQVGPRDEFPGLDRSRTLARIDDTPVWSVNCFVVLSAYRRRGVGSALARAAVEYAESLGAATVEAYPYDDHRWVAVNFFTGTQGMFEEIGFEEVERRRPNRPVVRLELGNDQLSATRGSTQSIRSESPQSRSSE